MSAYEIDVLCYKNPEKNKGNLRDKLQKVSTGTISVATCLGCPSSGPKLARRQSSVSATAGKPIVPFYNA